MRNKGKNLIRKRVTRRVVIAILITVVLLSVANIAYMTRAINMGQRAELMLVTELSGSKVDKWVGGLSGVSEGIASTLEGLHTLDEDTVKSILDNIAEDYPELCFIYVATEEGNMYMARGVEYAPGVDVRERQWYKTVKALGRTAVVDPYISATRPNLMLATVATPIYFDGELVGIVGVDADVSTISDYINSLKLRDGAYGFLVDSEGRIITHPNNRFNPSITNVKYVDEVMPEISDLVNSPDGGLVSAKDYTGTNVLYDICSLDDCDWKIGIAFPRSFLLKSIDDGIQISIIIAVVCAILAGLETKRAISKMLKPIEKINPVMDKIMQGDFSTQIDFEAGNDEIGELQTRMALMLTTISEIIESEKYILGEMEQGNLTVEDMAQLPGDLNEIATSVNSIKETFNDIISDIQFSAINLQSFAMGINETSNIEEMRLVFEELSAEANALMEKTSRFTTHPS